MSGKVRRNKQLSSTQLRPLTGRLTRWCMSCMGCRRKR